MGGQVAEELFFGDVSTGPGGDLLYATNVAAEMTGSCGMGETLVSYAAIQNSAFSDTNIVGRVLGDAEGRAGSRSCCSGRRSWCAACSRATCTWSPRCATRWSSGTS